MTQPFKFYHFYLLFFVPVFLNAQKNASKPFELDFNYFYGNILEHSPAISHLITSHPQGAMLGFSRKTFGEKSWQHAYNYPDWGFSFLYQDMGNQTLGDQFGLYAHLGFYFLRRNLLLKVGTGLAYNTNPYDQNSNYRNNAYGTSLLSSTFLLLNFKHRIYENIGFQTGITIVHYSNGNFKAPNTSTNTFAFNLGLNYDFSAKPVDYIAEIEKRDFSEPIHFNFVFRSGIQSSDVIGMGQFPFYIFSAYADKRIGEKSSFTLGTELFLSEMLEELIYYKSVAYPEENVSGDEDSKRVGIFGGYQLHVNKFSACANLGYYVYYPYDFEGRVYSRLGLQYAVSKNWFGGISVKSHAAKAEAVEFSVGYRL
ncbi:MAG TPA: acyloxyacyl hydrolase [Flavobacteriaceae bacterium]|nr:acyloxyacyl hydrolase [Flavobacteriaceae bacterium]